MSTKTPVQPGRRTPLSLSGAVTKSQTNKGSNNITNGGGVNANGHPSSSNSKQETKLQTQKVDPPTVSNSEAKETPNKKQTPQAEKKTQQNESKKSNEKSQNGAGGSNKQETNENKQQPQNKEKTQHQNKNDENKVNEKEKKEQSDKSEKDITKKKEQNLPQNKKDEKKNNKDSKDTKEDKKEVISKSDETTEIEKEIQVDDIKSKDEDKEKVKSVDKKSEEKEEKMDVVEDQITQKPSNPPDTPKSSSKANKTSTPVNKTPTKIGEKTPQKSTPTKTAKTVHVHKREETTTIDDNDIEMEPLTIENSPVKSPQPQEAANIKIVPSATSTPGKLLLSKRSSAAPKSDVQHSLDRPRMFSQISGRRSIRPISGYNPSKCLSNLEFCESYRRINTELDVTNTSMNVTVGSEVPSNFSFSFFGRGRKRDRTPPTQQSQSAIGELQTDIEVSPPKKARLDMYGLFSAVSSPISLLRNRFSKASLESSTPVKLQQKLDTAEDEIEVQNVSGVSVHEEITTPEKEPTESNLTTDDNDATLGEEAKETKRKTNAALSSQTKLLSGGEEFKKVSCEKAGDMEESYISETSFLSPVGDQMPKNKRCVVM